MLQPESRFGKYRIIRLLGQGGMADVYEAEEQSIGRIVALKVLPLAFARDQERAGRFAKEIKASAALDHPNIVSVFDVGEVDGLHYYTMSVLPGGDLKHRLRDSALPEADAIRITKEIAAALSYAHDRGFVHRDVKPENILFREDGSAVLTDFGIARATGSQTRMTATGLSIGTPHYMSPEQARGQEVDRRSDLYALGVVFHEMLTGRVPFDAQDSFAVGLMHISDAPPVLPRDRSRMQPVLDRLLAKRPVDRYQNGTALIADLERLAQGEIVAAAPARTRLLRQADVPGAESSNHGPSGRGGWVWGLAGAALACLLAILVVAIRPDPEGPSVQSVLLETPPEPAPAVSGQVSERPERIESEIAWEQAREVDTEEAYAVFLRRYGASSGRADEARARQEELKEARVRSIEQELVRLGRDVRVDGNFFDEAQDEVRRLENLLGRQVRGVADPETLALLRSLDTWPGVTPAEADVASWDVGDVVDRAELTRPVLLPGFEDFGPLPLMELFQEQVAIEDGGQAIIAVVHGLGGEGSEWTELDPALVTVATRHERGFRVVYRQDFGWFPEREIYKGRLRGVELIPPVMRIDRIEYSATRNFFLTDWLGLSGDGEIVDVEFIVPDGLDPGDHLRNDEGLSGKGPLIHRNGEFYRVASVYRDRDASCCPSGGTVREYFELRQEQDSVSFVAVRWEHEREDGSIRRSPELIETASARPISESPVPAVHLEFDGSSPSSRSNRVRFHGDMLYDDGIRGLAPDFRNPRTSNPFAKKHYVSFAPLNAREFTVSLWFNFEYNAHEHQASLYSTGSSTPRPGNTGFRIGISRDGKVSAVLVAGRNTSGTVPVPISRSRWHFVSAVVSNDAIDLYLDGAKVASSEVDFPFSFADSAQYLGFHAWNEGNSGSSRFTGRIDELTLHLEPLNDDQIRSLYLEHRDGSA